MSRTTTALTGALVAAALTLAIVATIIAVRGASIAQTLADPTIWLVEGATITLAALAVLTRPTDSGTDASPDTPARRPNVARVVATQTAWAIAGALLIGALLALGADIPIRAVLTSPTFLIPAAIAVLVAAAEAWPDNHPPRQHR